MELVNLPEIQEQRRKQKEEEYETQDRKELVEKHGEDFLRKVLAEFPSVFKFRFFAPNDHPLKVEWNERAEQQRRDYLASLDPYDTAVMEQHVQKGKTELFQVLRNSVEREKRGEANVAIFPGPGTAASAG